MTSKSRTEKAIPPREVAAAAPAPSAVALNLARLSADGHLEAILDTITDGLAVFDSDERLVLFNHHYKFGIWSSISDVVEIGVSIEEMIRAVYRTSYEGSDGVPDLETFVARALARHRDLPSASEFLWPDGKWIRQSKHVAPSGHVVAVFTDITEIKENEKAASHQKARLQAVIDGSPDGIIVVLDGRIGYATQLAAGMLGYAGPNDLIGRDALDLVAPGERESVLDTRRTLLTGDSARELSEITMVRSDDTSFTARVWAVHVEWEGSPAVLAIMRDQTEISRTRDALRESEAQYRNLVENIPGFVYQRRLERDGTITYPFISDAAQDVWGYTAEQVTTEPELLRRAIHPEDRDAYLSAVMKSFEDMQQFSGDIRYRHPTKGWRWHHTISRPRRRPDGSIVAEAIAFDITDRKTTESELEENRRHLNQHIIELQDTKERLEVRTDELVRTIGELAEARDAAEEASRAKSEFLATMSHEIRTPMNGVLGMASLLAQTKIDGIQADYLDTIQQSGEALLEIINDILDYSKMEAGQLDLERREFSLLEVLDGAVQLLRPRYDQKELNVRTLIGPDVPDTVIGDSGRFRQILLNLLGNAVKFTEGGSITVQCTNPQFLGRQVELEFSVTDTGIGISEEAQKGLFQVFSQADASTTRKYGGTGLGLSICKRLCHLMGGEITVESRPSEGSTFRFTVRFDTAEPQGSANLRDRVMDSGLNAMIISSPSLPDCGLRRQLEIYGIRVLEGTEAENCEGIDLVIIDQNSANATDPLIQAFLRGHVDDPATVWIIARTGAGWTRPQTPGLKTRYFELPLRQTHLRTSITELFSPVEAPQPAPSDAEKETVPAIPALPIELKVLLVEDNAVNQRVATALLHSFGAQVVIAENGLEAVEAVQGEPFDVVLMDIHMPEMDGVTAAREIRNLPEPFCSIPIIALTANAMAGDRERYLEAGMDDYVSKPVSPTVLAEAIFRQSGIEVKSARRDAPPAAPPEHVSGSDVEAVFDRFDDLID